MGRVRLCSLVDQSLECYKLRRFSDAIYLLLNSLECIVADRPSRPAGGQEEFDIAASTLVNFLTELSAKAETKHARSLAFKMVVDAEFILLAEPFFTSGYLYCRIASQILILRATLLLQQGNHKESLHYFSKALRFEQKTNDAAYRLCPLYFTNSISTMESYDKVHAVASLFANLASMQSLLGYNFNAVQNSNSALKLIRGNLSNIVFAYKTRSAANEAGGAPESIKRLFSLATVISYNLGVNYERIAQLKLALMAFRNAHLYMTISDNPVLTKRFSAKIADAIDRVSKILVSSRGARPHAVSKLEGAPSCERGPLETGARMNASSFYGPTEAALAELYAPNYALNDAYDSQGSTAVYDNTLPYTVPVEADMGQHEPDVAAFVRTTAEELRDPSSTVNRPPALNTLFTASNLMGSGMVDMPPRAAFDTLMGTSAIAKNKKAFSRKRRAKKANSKLRVSIESAVCRSMDQSAKATSTLADTCSGNSTKHATITVPPSQLYEHAHWSSNINSNDIGSSGRASTIGRLQTLLRRSLQPQCYATEPEYDVIAESIGPDVALRYSKQGEHVSVVTSDRSVESDFYPISDDEDEPVRCRTESCETYSASGRSTKSQFIDAVGNLQLPVRDPAYYSSRKAPHLSSGACPRSSALSNLINENTESLISDIAAERQVSVEELEQSVMATKVRLACLREELAIKVCSDSHVRIANAKAARMHKANLSISPDPEQNDATTEVSKIHSVSTEEESALSPPPNLLTMSSVGAEDKKFCSSARTDDDTGTAVRASTIEVEYPEHSLLLESTMSQGTEDENTGALGMVHSFFVDTPKRSSAPVRHPVNSPETAMPIHSTVPNNTFTKRINEGSIASPDTLRPAIRLRLSPKRVNITTVRLSGDDTQPTNERQLWLTDDAIQSINAMKIAISNNDGQGKAGKEYAKRPHKRSRQGNGRSTLVAYK